MDLTNPHTSRLVTLKDYITQSIQEYLVTFKFDLLLHIAINELCEIFRSTSNDKAVKVKELDAHVGLVLSTLVTYLNYSPQKSLLATLLIDRPKNKC